MFRLVILSHIDSYIRQNTFFQRLHIFVEMRTGGEADAPSVRQFRCERKSRTATCLVTDLDDLAIVYAAHQIDEIIGCTVATAVGQYNDFLLPADAVGRIQVNRAAMREELVRLPPPLSRTSIISPLQVAR